MDSLARRRLSSASAPRGARHLVFDFDSTITCDDTIATLVASAIARRPPSAGTALRRAWDDAARAYAADARAHAAAFRPPPAQRALADEVRFQRSLKRDEEASLDRVGHARVLAGLGPRAARDAGREAVAAGRVVVRDGFAELVALARGRGWRVDVVSANWSAAFVQGVVGGDYRDDEEEEDDDDDDDDENEHKHNHKHDGEHSDASPLCIVANHIDPASGHILGPRLLGTRLTTSADKLRALDLLPGAPGVRLVFFGDSGTDLECLLHAGATGGAAVVVAPEGPARSPLAAALARAAAPVADLPAAGARAAAGVFWARDFRHVLQSALLAEP